MLCLYNLKMLIKIKGDVYCTYNKITNKMIYFYTILISLYESIILFYYFFIAMNL